jgi:nitrate reductase alpha subunit
MDKLGNGGKGISWNTQNEVDFLGKLNYVKRRPGERPPAD